MQREPFNSSTILTAGYDPANETLEIEFRNHRLYRYLDVAPPGWPGVGAAPTAGADLTANKRNQ
jgi:hypothetical protein